MDYIENKALNIIEQSKNGKILFWRRYVDDVIAITDNSEHIDYYTEVLNSINPNIKFTTEFENNDSLNFLDLTLIKNYRKISFKIYRKPTHTEHCIHFQSNHPYTHKMSFFNNCIHRLYSVPLSEENFKLELLTILQIANNNGYSNSTIKKLTDKKLKSIKNHLAYPIPINTENKRYFSIPYLGPISFKIAKLLSNDHVTISFNNTVNIRSLFVKLKDPTCDLQKSGVYKLVCPFCLSSYIGQSGRSIECRLKEHVSAFVNKTDKSSFGSHAIEGNCNITCQNVKFELLHQYPKGSKLDIAENLEIVLDSKNNSKNLNNQTNCLYSKYLKSFSL